MTTPSTLPECPELRLAVEAARLGGQIVADYFERGVQMRSKADEAAYNLVSDADVESEQAIARAILGTFPEHQILGEEEQQGSLDAEHLWIIDPLDGTNNFAHRIPHFAVSIAYYYQGVAQCGVVLNPIRGECYWAQRGQGAFEGSRRLRVSPAKSLDEVMVGVGFYYDRGAMMEATLAAIHGLFKQQIHGIRRFGTAALDLCQVADGLFGAYFEYQLSPWDFAAGRLIVEEAGGTITDGRGAELPLAKTSVLASNGHLHPSTLAIVGQHHPA
ncbi:MAG: inositol monophosphatase family protein [Pirellulaceae bacterium]